MYIRIQCGRQPASEEVVLNLVSGAYWCSDGELSATLVARAGGVVSQRGEGAALSTSSSLSLWVWRIMRAALTSWLLSSPPSVGSTGGSGGGLSAAVAGQDRR